jgi:ubiquinone/menaquinone biosynthesis C-methylase UbiE
MSLLHTLRRYLRPARQPESDPATAYDLWSFSYDDQPDNLMLALDEQLFGELLSAVSVTGAWVADVGCGTGRHWEKLFDRLPARLVGYDVSPGMLGMLRKKYPRTETYMLSDTTLTGLDAASCNLVLSTLTLAHIPDLAAALTEWDRVLKPGGDLIITDYHPTALARGGQRTFRNGGATIAVRNYIHPVSTVLTLARQLGFREITFAERVIDDTMRPYYEKQNALPVFRRFLGVPIIYGFHLKKPDAAQ